MELQINNVDKYLIGFIIGMCLEYLIRVEFNFLPVIIIVCMIFMIIVDYTSIGEDNEDSTANGAT